MSRSRSSPRHQRLGQLLLQARQAAGLTQIELAARLHHPQSYVSKYESGERRLDVIELMEVADGIGCRVEEVIVALRTAEP